jgi:palmitoyl-protein thioesterase
MKSFAMACIAASAAATQLPDLKASAVPTAIFHGLGDACANPGMIHFTKEIADGTAADAVCLEVGNGAETSIFTNFETQADKACAALNADETFSGEFNVAGLS